MVPEFDRDYVSEYMHNTFDSPSGQHIDAAHEAMNRQDEACGSMKMNVLEQVTRFLRICS